MRQKASLTDKLACAYDILFDLIKKLKKDQNKANIYDILNAVNFALPVFIYGRSEHVGEDSEEKAQEREHYRFIPKSTWGDELIVMASPLVSLTQKYLEQRFQGETRGLHSSKFKTDQVKPVFWNPIAHDYLRYSMVDCRTMPVAAVKIHEEKRRALRRIKFEGHIGHDLPKEADVEVIDLPEILRNSPAVRDLFRAFHEPSLNNYFARLNNLYNQAMEDKHRTRERKEIRSELQVLAYLWCGNFITQLENPPRRFTEYHNLPQDRRL